MNPEPEECLERLRLVDEYSRAVTAFNSILESLRAASPHPHPASWSAAESARAQSQVAWEAVERHILLHRCLNLHWTAASEHVENVFGLAATSAPDVVVVLNDLRQFVDLNKAGEEMFGMPRHEVVGRKIEEFFRQAYGESVSKAWKTFLAEGVQGGICEFISTGRRHRFAYRAKANFAPGLHLSVLRQLKKARK